MSNDTDKIREMVMALSRGDHEAAQQASSEVMTSKMSTGASDESESEGES